LAVNIGRAWASAYERGGGINLDNYVKGNDMAGRLWTAIMDGNSNPLMRLPKTVRFQLMAVLALLWSVIFCVSAGLLVWLPGYVFVHIVLIAIGIFGTRWAFSSVEQTPKSSA